MSDEVGCPPRYPGGRYCPESRFQCTNNLCVSTSDLCDGTDDCGDGSDENSEANKAEYTIPEINNVE